MKKTSYRCFTSDCELSFAGSIGKLMTDMVRTAQAVSSTLTPKPAVSLQIVPSHLFASSINQKLYGVMKRGFQARHILPL